MVIKEFPYTGPKRGCIIFICTGALYVKMRSFEKSIKLLVTSTLESPMNDLGEMHLILRDEEK